MILHYTFLTAFFFKITISLLFQFMQLQLEVHAAEDLSPSSINLKPKKLMRIAWCKKDIDYPGTPYRVSGCYVHSALSLASLSLLR